MRFIPQVKKGIILRIIQMIPGIVAVLGIFILLWLWFSSGPERDLQKRIPENDISGSEVSIPQEEYVSPASRGKLVKSGGIPAELPGAWPRFRGKNFDGISNEEPVLDKNWEEGEPKELWAIDVGEGYASAAILNGRVYMLDYDQKEQADALRCLSLADGKEIWRYSYPVKVKRYHGMSRTVPAVTEKYVVSLGPKCHFTCLDSITGEFYWMLDLVRDFGTKVPEWYAGQCPLIDDGKAIIAPGGDDALMIAVDCETGEIIWKTPNPHNWDMTHSSIIPMEFNGQRMYVYCASGGVVGVSADDGSILWETDEWKVSIATIPSPLILDNGRIFLSGGYNTGSMMLQLVKRAADSLEENESEGTTTEDYPYVAETLFRLESKVFGSEQQTPIFFEGYIYGVRTNGELVCLNPKGELVWKSGTSHRFGLGPYMIANGLIYVMNDSGLLTLVEATPEGYKQLAQSQVLNGHDSWGPMAIVEGRLIIRDMTRMVCLDVREK